MSRTSNEVVSLRKSMTSDMKSDLQPAAMSDEHGGGESMAEARILIPLIHSSEIERIWGLLAFELLVPCFLSDSLRNLSSSRYMSVFFDIGICMVVIGRAKSTD